jgi:uncharacterized protein YkwD
MKRFGRYSFANASENIAYGNFVPKKIIMQLFNSASHRKAMLDGGFGETGIAFCKDP